MTAREASWGQFAAARSDMAAVGEALLARHGIAYLATVRADGSPRLHPVCPFIIDGRLYVATPATSPKVRDQLRDARYALHMLPGADDAECMLRGEARHITEDAERAAVQAGGPSFLRPDDHYFEYLIREAMTARWEHVGQPGTYAVREWWRAREGGT